MSFNASENDLGDATAATAAIPALNETEWLERKIVVNEARQREERLRNNY